MPPALTLEILRQAIEQLRPELPALLGDKYPAFETQLNSGLASGNRNRLLDLFRQYGTAHQRLLQYLPSRAEDRTKGLFGDVNVPLPYLHYVCPVGPHLLRLKQVEEQDAAGRPLCPVHHVPMTRMGPKALRAAVETFRPQLPQLIGPEYQDFVAKFKISLTDPGEDAAWELLAQHDALYQRLLQTATSG